MRTIIGLAVSKASEKLSVALLLSGKTIHNGDITLEAIRFQSLKSIIQSYGDA